MNLPNHIPAPPSEPAWEITFTRIVRAALPQVEACVAQLAGRFHALGFSTDLQVRQTPRGQSVFLSLIGHYGLTGIVDFTLVDGMAVSQGPSATLDARLIDACGEVVAAGLTSSVEVHEVLPRNVGPTYVLENLDCAANAVYVEALAHFSLLRSVAQGD